MFQQEDLEQEARSMPQLWVTPEELGEDSGSPFAYEACQSATYILWVLSGRKYHGVQTTTEHYECPCSRYAGQSVFNTEAYLVDGMVINRYRSNDCGCDTLHDRVRLRGRPVQAVSKVISQGVELTPADYVVVNRSVLTATSTGLLDPCDVTVTYTFGARPPVAGARAARYLAEQLVKSWSGGDCDLPDRVTSISRQGVSYTILDNQDFLDSMRTGVYAVDLFLKATNPDNARKRAKVFSPDLPRARQVTAGAYGSQTPALGPYDFQATPGEAASWTFTLTGSQAEILGDADWSPRVEFSSWNGAIAYTAAADRVSIAAGDLTIALTASDTSAANMSGSTQWDLYAESVVQPGSVVHLQTGNIYFTQPITP